MLSQNDTRWKLKRINGTSSTLGNFGCLITCITYILNKAGYDITPDVLAKKSELFDGDMWTGWNTLEKSFPKVKYVWGEKCISTPAPIEKIIREVKDGYVPIIMLDYSPKAGVQTHYLAVIGCDDKGNLLVGDPIDGAEVWLDSRYGTLDEDKKILKVDIYHFEKPPMENNEFERIKKFLEEKDANEGKVREAFGALADKGNLERTIEDLRKSLTNKQKAIESKDSLLSELTTTINGLEAGLKNNREFKEAVAKLLGSTTEEADILANIVEAISNEDKYTGCLTEKNRIVGSMEEIIEKRVTDALYDHNVKKLHLSREIDALRIESQKQQSKIENLQAIVDGKKKTLLDFFYKLFKLN